MPPSTDDLLYPGYYTDPVTGAWCTLPWPGDKTKDYGVPERLALLPDSLGPGVIAWCERYLVHPKTGEPWRFTPGQKRFLHLWYAVNDEGYFLYRSGVKRGAKGTGKDYLAAAMVCAEFCGPVHLAGWDGDTPVGEPQRMALVQIGANSLKQTNEVLGLANAMFSKELVKKLKIDTGITRTLKPGGSRIVGLTSSEKSAEGDPATFIALNEALALDTPVPTPSGWTTMGRLEEGSIIIGSGGKPVRVVQALPVQEGRTCYRVTFSDGTSIVASDGHLWAAKRSAYPNAKVKIYTTREMAEADYATRVPRNKGLVDSPDCELPVDPWVLGYWLGNGDKTGPVLSCDNTDVPELCDIITQRGYTAKPLPSDRAGRVYVSIPGRRTGGPLDKRPMALKGVLRSLFPEGVKRIPTEYLRASMSQRVDIIRGLIDSDGCVTKDGYIIFVNTNRAVVDGLVELLRSIGELPSIEVQDDAKYTSGRCYRVFYAPRVVCPASLRRKADRVKLSTSAFGVYESITSIEQVASVPVRCISVDAPDHLFVAGDGWKLTHNTHHFTEASGGHKLAAVARRNVGKSPAWIQGRLCEFTNAHQMGVDSVAEQSFEAWQAQAMGRTRLKDILYDSIEAPPGLDMYSLDDIATGLAAAYMDAPWADFNRLTGEIQDTRTTPADTIRFYFNGLAAEEDAWCDPGAFDDCAHPEIVVEKGEKIALFLDCSKNEDCTVLVGCRLSDGHIMSLGCWQRPHGKKPEDWAVPREDVDAHVQDAMKTYKVCWFGVDPSPAKDEETGHLYWMPLIDSWHQQYARKLPVWATPGRGGHSVLFDMRQSQPGGRDRMRIFTEQAMQTVEEIEEEHSLTHDGNPILRQHVFNAKRRPNQWGIGLGKLNRDSEKKVDYAVAMVGARMGRILALRSGKVTPRRTGGAKRIKL